MSVSKPAGCIFLAFWSTIVDILLTYPSIFQTIFSRFWSFRKQVESALFCQKFNLQFDGFINQLKVVQLFPRSHGSFLSVFPLASTNTPATQAYYEWSIVLIFLRYCKIFADFFCGIPVFSTPFKCPLHKWILGFQWSHRKQDLCTKRLFNNLPTKKNYQWLFKTTLTLKTFLYVMSSLSTVYSYHIQEIPWNW